MPAMESDIKRWLAEAKKEGATHLIVRCDTFDAARGDSCCYPISVLPGEDPKEQAGFTAEGVYLSGDRLMEVYSLTGKYTIEEQMAELRAFHYD